MAATMASRCGCTVQLAAAHPATSRAARSQQDRVPASVLPVPRPCLQRGWVSAFGRGVWQAPCCSRPLRRSLVVVAASDTETAATEVKADRKVTYHYVVANAKFILDEEEHLQEVLRERQHHLLRLGEERNFWVVYEPAFLDKAPSEVLSRLSRPAAAVISTDGTWMTFVKLRMDRVLKGEFEGPADFRDALAAKVEQEAAQFEEPKNWVAPYPKYEGLWWTQYLPGN